MVHSRAGFAHIGEANAEFQQAWKFMGFIAARRDADLVDRAPEAIAGMRVGNGLRSADRWLAAVPTKTSRRCS